MHETRTRQDRAFIKLVKLNIQICRTIDVRWNVMQATAHTQLTGRLSKDERRGLWGRGRGGYVCTWVCTCLMEDIMCFLDESCQTKRIRSDRHNQGKDDDDRQHSTTTTTTMVTAPKPVKYKTKNSGYGFGSPIVRQRGLSRFPENHSPEFQTNHERPE